MHRLDYFPKRDLIYQYRKLFSSSLGLDVLSHMLHEFGVFSDTTEGPEDIALKNYGNRLLRILGAGLPGEDAVKRFTKRLMTQPIPKETPDE